jgi:hypothetical protein
MLGVDNLSTSQYGEFAAMVMAMFILTDLLDDSA